MGNLESTGMVPRSNASKTKVNKGVFNFISKEDFSEILLQPDQTSDNHHKTDRIDEEIIEQYLVPDDELEEEDYVIEDNFQVKHLMTQS